MPAIKVFAPAKINLTLHVTGQRADRYHLLDSLVMFATVGDEITLNPSETMLLQVTGPRAQGVPADARNLCWKAAERFGLPVDMVLDKRLPAAAGIGGGSSDAAAVLRGCAELTGRDIGFDPITLGADLPVCLTARAARMAGIGEEITPLDLPDLYAVLVNPGVEITTPATFKALASKTNPPMGTIPQGARADAVIDWLAGQRNDLEPPACQLAPVVTRVLDALRGLPDQRLVRMSGSGATCFALFDTQAQADAAARDMEHAHPEWWVAPCRLR